jgi:hypothetical protein
MVMTTLELKHKVMLSVNALLGLLYVVSSYWIWAEVEKWFKWSIASNWTPFLIYPYRNPDLPQLQMVIPPLLNFPFILFCVILAVNLYFIIRLQRIETK